MKISFNLKKWVVVVACGLLLILANVFPKRIVHEVSKQSPTVVSEILTPRTIEELQTIVRSSHKPISVAGGKFSQGGQIAYPHGIVIDITKLNRIIAIDTENKRITVQTGARWRDIQKVIDTYNLSVKIMQSYNDFTVGGSLSVNVHGRSFHGSLVKSVESIKVLIADGSIVEADRTKNADLFSAAIGGYGLVGIIIEATLALTDNERIERSIKIISRDKYPHFFFNHLRNHKDIVFHNANLYPDDFNEALSITWHTTNKPLTNEERLQSEGIFLREKLEEQLLRRISPLKKLRQQIEPKLLKSNAVVWRNYEMSYSVEALEPLVRFPTTSILQEYFVPVHRLHQFIFAFKKIVNEYDVNVLNVSIRYVPQDSETLLSYAPEDMFALVCYINVWRSEKQTHERNWTQKLINHALSLGGGFYLPYHLYATPAQFKKAYPRYAEFIAVKEKYDPHHRFMNSLYKKYIVA